MAEGRDEDEPAIEYEMAYYAPSGFDRRFSFLGMRYDVASGFRSSYGETFVASAEPHPTQTFTFGTHYMLPGWFTGLWRSEAERVWVCESRGRVFAFADPKCSSHVLHQLDAALFGIHGWSDAQLITWGDRGGAPLMFAWDGTAWSAMPDPPFCVLSAHGSGPGDFWIAGNHGGLARWDGATWRVVKTDTDETLVSAFAVAPASVVACGNCGTVFQGSDKGLQAIGAIPNAQVGDVTAVALWRGQLWVAANRLGLWRRVGTTSRFECVKPNIEAVGMDARKDLVLACRRVVVHTEDGEKWMGTGRDVLLTMRGQTPLGGTYP